VTIQAALREINNAVLDLQAADYNTFERPLERLAAALNADELRQVTSELRSKADFDKFVESANEGGSFMGSARLKWPSARDEELGLVIHLLERAGKDPNWFLNFSHHYYYGSSKIISGIRKITTAVIIPFNRDFASYVNEVYPSVETANTKSSYSVNYNIGTMTNSPLQHVESGGHGIQTTNYAPENLQQIIDLYKSHVDELRLDAAQRRRADAQIATIEAQLLDEPDPTIIRAAGQSLKTIVEGAIGGAVGNALAAAPIWAPLLAMFS
jgi:hypothetical protein